MPGCLSYLCLGVDLGSLADEQGSHVCMALLRGQMERCDPLLGQDVGLSSVLQQHCGDLHLVLLGGDVQRSVAVLVRATEKRESKKPQTVFSNNPWHDRG